MRTPRYDVEQNVTVEIGRFDDGIRDLIKIAAGAPLRGSNVTFHEGGVRVTWTRTKRTPL